MYTDLLVKIKNAQAVKMESVKTAYSAMDNAVLEILKKNNFIAGFSVIGRAPKKVFEINIKYDKNGKGAISGVNILSKPSRHLYAGYKEVRPVKQGFGVLVMTTPKGLMDGKTAKKSGVGGELLFEVW